MDLRETRTGLKGTMALAAAVVLVFVVACMGLDGPSHISPEVEQQLEAIEPTEIVARSDESPMGPLEGAGAPPVDAGDGVQIVQVAPMGEVRRALQIGVIFDRPMVPLTQLDDMLASMPVSCEAAGVDVPLQGRWAGTSTAVLVPKTDNKALPDATEFECVIPAGIRAVDGTPLEKEVRWTFNTPRPAAMGTSPRDGKMNRLRPDTDLLVRFNQPIDVQSVASKIRLVSDRTGEEVPVSVAPDPDSPYQVVVTPRGMQRNTAYTLRVAPGFVGRSGPLPAKVLHTRKLRTYPPFRLREMEPHGHPVSPNAFLNFRFSTPVDSDAFVSKLSVEPPPPTGWPPPPMDRSSATWNYHFGLEPRTEYTVTLAPGLQDVFGQTLSDEAMKWTFTTLDHEPWLHLSQGIRIYPATNPLSLPYRHLNVQNLDLRVHSLPVEELLGVSQIEYLFEANEVQPMHLLPDVERNEVAFSELDLKPWLEGGEYGLVAYQMQSPQLLRPQPRDGKHERRLYSGAVLVTDLGAALKVGPDAVEAWVTRLSTGEVVPGAEVVFYRGKEPIGRATSDANGLARVQGGPIVEWAGYRSDPIQAVIRKGADATFLKHDWDDGIASYHFGIWGDYDQDGRSEVSHSFTDRGVYRPGDTVYARATFRAQVASGLEIPKAEVSWSFTDPDRNTIASGEGTLDDRGGFNLEAEIPTDGSLGTYHFEVQASGEGFSQREWIPVQALAYRAPAFRVSVDGPDERIAGDELTASVDARYLFGTPLSEASVLWQTWAEPTSFRPDGFDDFSFGPLLWTEDEEGYDLGASHRQRITAELDAGRHVMKMQLPVDAAYRPVQLMVEAEVTDVDRQAIANRAQVLVHSSEWYLGLRTTERLPQAGKPAQVEVVAVQPDGAVQSGVRADLKVYSRIWDRVRTKSISGQWLWSYEPVDTEVHSDQVRLTDQGATVRFTPERAGLHIIEVTSTDSRGNTVLSRDAVYVTGGDWTPWALSDDNKMELVPDKERYQPGDTARILVKSPKPGMEALVTLERQGVLWREVVTLDSTASVVEIPLDESHRPNVFVSVIAVTGAPPQDSPDKGRPEVRVGLAELVVDHEGARLQVEVQADEEVLRPRDEVGVTVQVRHGDKPVPNAGVTLYAVDESILSLTNYQTPDQLGPFYGRHRLSVLTADSRVRTFDRARYLAKGANRGGGGGEDESGPEIRSEFLTTIAWEPNLKTGPDGTVRHTLKLPDNLTTFRIMAVVDSGATAFGSADKEIRVTRPVIARPALPRFLRVGDTVFAGVVVHNNTDASRRIEVEAQVEGPVELTGAPVSVQVPAHGAAEVPFRLAVGDEPGEAQFEFTATSGQERDAVRSTLEVRRDIVWETVASTGSTEGVASERIARPDDASPDLGGLQVDLATTVLVGAGEGLDYLLTYPHRSFGTLTSQAMGALQAKQVREAAGVSLSEAELQRVIDEVLAELPKFQHYSGGMSYWHATYQGYPSTVLTAYVVEFLARAREAGVAIDEQRLDRCIRYLRGALAGHHSRAGFITESTRAYVAVGFARAGVGDAGLNNRLYEQREQLSVAGLAWLMEAISRTTGNDARVEDLERRILSRAYIEAASASIKEDQSLWYLWGSDHLSTAAVLEGLLVVHHTHPTAERFARFLSASRRAGRWHNTRSTAGVLAALARYHQIYERSGEPIQARVRMEGEPMLHETLDVPDSTALAVDMTALSDGDLEIEAEGGRLYYDARLRYVPHTLPARDEGFTLRRTYEVLEGGGGARQVTSGTLMRVTLQVITPITRHQVAVVDPLPAGLEAVHSGFTTSSQAPQPDDEDQFDAELPQYGGSRAFDHIEVLDHQVRLYATDMPPGIHTWRYLVRATTPGRFDHPAATVEEMHEPENFGRTDGGTFTVGRAGR